MPYIEHIKGDLARTHFGTIMRETFIDSDEYNIN